MREVVSLTAASAGSLSLLHKLSKWFYCLSACLGILHVHTVTQDQTGGKTATKNQSPSDQGSGRRSVKVSKSTSCKRPQQTLEIKALLTTLALCNPPSKKQCVAFSGLNWQKCNVIMFLPRVFNQNKALIKNRWESPTSQLVDSKSNTLETSNKFGSLGTKFMHGRNNK